MQRPCHSRVNVVKALAPGIWCNPRHCVIREGALNIRNPSMKQALSTWKASLAAGLLLECLGLVEDFAPA